MASAAELKNILDDRLVNGNITIDEYREMSVIVGLPAPPELVAEVEPEIDTVEKELIEEPIIVQEELEEVPEDETITTKGQGMQPSSQVEKPTYEPKEVINDLANPLETSPLLKHEEKPLKSTTKNNTATIGDDEFSKLILFGVIIIVFFLIAVLVGT